MSIIIRRRPRPMRPESLATEPVRPAGPRIRRHPDGRLDTTNFREWTWEDLCEISRNDTLLHNCMELAAGPRYPGHVPITREQALTIACVVMSEELAAVRENLFHEIVNKPIAPIIVPVESVSTFTAKEKGK